MVVRFGPGLQTDIDREAQEWWTTDPNEFDIAERGPRFTDLELVYGNGEFPWQGLWTVTDPPAATHEALGWVSEFTGTITRWRLPGGSGCS